MGNENRRFKTHTEFFEHCVSRTNGENNTAMMLNSIAESLAAIADQMEKNDEDSDN